MSPWIRLAEDGNRYTRRKLTLLLFSRYWQHSHCRTQPIFCFRKNIGWQGLGWSRRSGSRSSVCFICCHRLRDDLEKLERKASREKCLIRTRLPRWIGEVRSWLWSALANWSATGFARSRRTQSLSGRSSAARQAGTPHGTNRRVTAVGSPDRSRLGPWLRSS